MIQESLEYAILAKDFSQPQSSYEAAATLTEFELKKILIDKMDTSKSYLAAHKLRECYEGLRKSYNLDKSLFSTYGKVYSLKRSRKDKDKDEDPFAGSDRGLKKRKTSKDAEPTKGPKDSNMPQDQEDNLSNDDVEPKEKTPQQGQNQSWLIALASSDNKPSKTFNESMSTPIDFSAFIMNGLKINNLTQETLLGPAFRLLKGTHSNYAELEYDFEECYKALSEKLNWENPEGGDYPFDLTKPLPLVMSRNHQKLPVDYFFNNDLNYLQEGILTMTYTTSLTKTKASQYDLPGIEDMVPNLWVPVKVAYDKHAVWGISCWREQRKSFYGYAQGLQSRHDVYFTKRILAVNQVEVMRKHRYEYLKEIVVRKADNELYRFKEGDFPHLRINDIEDMLLLVVQNRLINLSGDDVSDFAIALLMFTKSLVIQKQVKDLQLRILKSSNYDSNAREARQHFKDYTQMEAQSFKDLIIYNMESIEKCIIERAGHEQEIHNRMKRLNERKLQIQECMVQKVKASDSSSGKVDSNVIPDSPDMCDNEIHTDQNAVECDDECVALANLIANLKLDIDENKKIQKQLMKENVSLTQDLK
ncbi:hypothetical protein Tco_0394867 [Tanacetum coccineum]